MSNPALLLTRPEAQARAFAELVQAQCPGVQIVISPLQRIEPTLPRTLPEADALIFTSVNAVAEYTALSPAQGRAAYCVGDRTADAARAVGFAAQSAGGNAEALIKHIRGLAPQGAILHPTGRHTRGDVAARLRQSGLNVREIVVYDQIEHPLSAEGTVLLKGGGPVVVPLFSPRSAALFSAYAGPRHDVHAICMSDAVRDALDGEFAQIDVIPDPTGQNMLKAVLGGISGRLSP